MGLYIYMYACTLLYFCRASKIGHVWMTWLIQDQIILVLAVEMLSRDRLEVWQSWSDASQVHGMESPVIFRSSLLITMLHVQSTSGSFSTDRLWYFCLYPWVLVYFLAQKGKPGSNSEPICPSTPGRFILMRLNWEISQEHQCSLVGQQFDGVSPQRDVMQGLKLWARGAWDMGQLTVSSLSHSGGGFTMPGEDVSKS